MSFVRLVIAEGILCPARCSSIPVSLSDCVQRAGVEQCVPVLCRNARAGAKSCVGGWAEEW